MSVQYCCDNYHCHWHVYSGFAADGTPLYVGQTGQVSERLYQHSLRTFYGESLWWLYCTRIEIGPQLRSLRVARVAERAEIARLRPVFNIHHNLDPSPWVAPAPIAPLLARERVWLDSLPTERATA